MKLFEERIVPFDWSAMQRHISSESALALNDYLQSLVSECFPVITKKKKSTDAAWFNPKIKKLIARKRRIYRAEGKSQKYIEARRVCDIEIKKAKRAFLEKIKTKAKEAKDTRDYYRTVKMFGTKNVPKTLANSVHVS